MLHRRGLIGISTRFKFYRIRHLCDKAESGVGNKHEKSESSVAPHCNETESSVSRYHETYKKLDNLGFVTAAKILFTEPPKNKKFGVAYSKMAEEVCDLLLSDLSEDPNRESQLRCFEDSLQRSFTRRCKIDTSTGCSLTLLSLSLRDCPNLGYLATDLVSFTSC